MFKYYPSDESCGEEVILKTCPNHRLTCVAYVASDSVDSCPLCYLEKVCTDLQGQLVNQKETNFTLMKALRAVGVDQQTILCPECKTNFSVEPR